MQIPKILLQSIDDEQTEFVVKPRRALTTKGLKDSIWFAVLWIGILVGFVIIGGENIKQDFDLSKFRIIIIPIAWIIIGVLPLFLSVYSYFFKKANKYFAATPTRLIVMESNKVRSIDWEQFTGEIKLGGLREDTDLTLILRTGYKKTEDKNGSKYTRFVHHEIEISGIEESEKVERVCRARISENSVGYNTVIPDTKKETTNSTLDNYLNGEVPEFRVQTSRKRPLSESILYTGSGLVMGVTLLLFSIFDFQWILALFVPVGFAVFGFGIYTFFEGGGTFAATPKKLLEAYKGKITATPWHEYSGDITVNLEAGKASVILGKKATSSGYGSDNNMGYIPEVTNILGITDAFAIGNICRKRIKENDYSPVEQVTD